MQNLILELRLAELDEYKELFELLLINYDELPKEVQLKIDELIK